jgi:alkanesulfonate monooxygenase SsuD/methylene tetrahydromethanopterin reductase-like flavin-dependent oxidoreductase (luciferase family)
VSGTPQFGLAYDVLAPGVGLGDHAVRLLDDIVAAEELGYDSVWFGETHRAKPGHGHGPAPLLAAAAVAARTTRLQIGTAVLLLAAQTPLQTAEQAATIDQLSRGRLLLGVAPGLEVYRDFGFENFGFGPKDLQPMMDEALDVIKALWTEDRVSFEGEHYRYVDAACFPRPWRSPGPPLLVGGITGRSIERAAVRGDGWVGGTPYPLALVAEVRRRYLAAVAEHGGEPGPFALIRPIVVAETTAEARRLAAEWVEPVIDYYLHRGAYFRENFRSVKPDAVDAEVRAEAIAGIPIVGDPDGCVEQIERYAEEVGVDHFIFRVRFPGQDDVARARMLRLLADEVLPRVRSLERATAD